MNFILIMTGMGIIFSLPSAVSIHPGSWHHHMIASAGEDASQLNICMRILDLNIKSCLMVHRRADLYGWRNPPLQKATWAEGLRMFTTAKHISEEVPIWNQGLAQPWTRNDGSCNADLMWIQQTTVSKSLGLCFTNQHYVCNWQGSIHTQKAFCDTWWSQMTLLRQALMVTAVPGVSITSLTSKSTIINRSWQHVLWHSIPLCCSLIQAGRTSTKNKIVNNIWKEPFALKCLFYSVTFVDGTNDVWANHKAVGRHAWHRHWCWPDPI